MKYLSTIADRSCSPAGITGSDPVGSSTAGHEPTFNFDQMIWPGHIA